MLKTTTPYEVKLSVNGSCYHVIAGCNEYGNYICIPNWDIGCEATYFSDVFWNIKKLTRHVGEKDAISIAKGLKLVQEIFE